MSFNNISDIIKLYMIKSASARYSFQLTCSKQLVLIEETSYRKKLIDEFISYIRQRNKIVIDLNRLVTDKVYNGLFVQVYFNKLFTEPNKFVSYHKGICFYSDIGNQIFTYHIKSSKYFETYYYILFNILDKCDFCSNDKIKIVCLHCRAHICCDCFEEFTSTFYRYNNQFRCRRCLQLNWWD